MSVSPVLPLAARRSCLLAGAVTLLGLAGCASVRSTERAEPYANQEWLQSGANRIANLSLRDNLQSVRRVQSTLYMARLLPVFELYATEPEAVASFGPAA